MNELHPDLLHLSVWKIQSRNWPWLKKIASASQNKRLSESGVQSLWIFCWAQQLIMWPYMCTGGMCMCDRSIFRQESSINRSEYLHHKSPKQSTYSKQPLKGRKGALLPHQRLRLLYTKAAKQSVKSTGLPTPHALCQHIIKSILADIACL